MFILAFTVALAATTTPPVTVTYTPSSWESNWNADAVTAIETEYARVEVLAGVARQGEDPALTRCLANRVTWQGALLSIAERAAIDHRVAILTEDPRAAAHATAVLSAAKLTSRQISLEADGCPDDVVLPTPELIVNDGLKAKKERPGRPPPRWLAALLTPPTDAVARR